MNILEDMTAAATEAELEQNRHEMEAAVLATVARHGLKAEALLNGFIRLDWTRTDFRAIADAIEKIVINDNIPVDLVILQNELRDAPVKVEEAVLTGILDRSQARELTVAGKYVSIMEEQDLLRRANEAGREYMAAVEKAGESRKAGDVESMVAGLLENTYNLVHKKKLIREYPREAEAALGFLEKLAARRIEGRKFEGLDCGFNHLNEIFNGLTKGVFVLAGAPGCGKTTLAKQIADHVAQYEKVPVLFWSFEQSKEELRIKSLARRAKIDSRVIWKGREADKEKLKQAAADYHIGEGPYLTIIEAGRENTLDRIRAAAVMAKHKAGGRSILVIIDYLQIIPAGKDAPEEIRLKVDWHLSELCRLARDITSPVLVISSENREAYKGNEKPTMAALKESGGIEYSADKVVCLWRNKKDSDDMEKDRQARRPDDPKTVRVEAFVLKNRNGEPGRVKLDFTPAWASFNNETNDPDGLSYEEALGE